jgi:hypothetical protein
MKPTIFQQQFEPAFGIVSLSFKHLTVENNYKEYKKIYTTNNDFDAIVQGILCIESI